MWHVPGGPGVRVGSHVYNNYFVPPNYGSRSARSSCMAIRATRRWPACAALSETVVEGISTNVPLHQELMVDANFITGGTNIHYLEEWLSQHKR